MKQDNNSTPPTPSGTTVQRFHQEARDICQRAGIARENVHDIETELIDYLVKNWRLEYAKTSEPEAVEIVLQNTPALLESLRKRPAERLMFYDEFMAHRYLAILCFCSLPGLTLAFRNQLADWQTWGMEITFGAVLVLVLGARSAIKSRFLLWILGTLVVAILIRHARLTFEVFPTVFFQQFHAVFTPLSIFFKSLELISAPVLYCFVLLELRICPPQSLKTTIFSFGQRLSKVRL